MDKLIPYQFIATPEQWQTCLKQLRQEPRLGLDLEANSLFAYRERVCLIQISTAQWDYIIDPLPLPDLEGLGEIIVNPAVEKVFHAAEYDLILLKRHHGWELNNLFDTMWAVRVLGYKQMGLASLLQQHFGVTQNKKHQRANWCARPLTREQLAYAQIDSHYLLPLRDILYSELQRGGRLEEALEIFGEHTRVKAPPIVFDPNSFWQINGARDLSARQQAVLKELHLFRHEEAERTNRPLYRIFADRSAVELAEMMPESLEELPQVYGMSPGQIMRYGRRLLQVIREGKKAPLPKLPKRPERPADEVLVHFDQLHHWRKEQAMKRGVESDVILSREALWALAETRPRSWDELETIHEIGPVRRQLYGAELLKLLSKR
ncbi:MAG: HRDC domain-containing protein [Chloroflexi bacterium]|nr:HRDC domain-containing protein [Chloroflexota bacterium]MBP8058821.1 HRDC domain-containing protein [Chloroflexota bacterium]